LVNGALRPFEVRAPGEGRQFGLMDRLVGVDLVGVFGITDWLEVGGTVPVAQLPVQSVFAEALGGTLVDWSMGDIRLEARGRILDPSKEPVGLAANVFVGLPTGNELAGLGRGLPSVGARFIVAREGTRLRVAGNLGFGVYAPGSIANLTSEHELTYGVGVGFRPVPDRLDINLELDGSLTAGPSAAGIERFGDPTHSPLELLFSIRGRLPLGFSVQVGAGRGLTQGFGSPALRLFASVSWALDTPPDKDGDGVRNRDDACVTDPEDRDGFEDEDGCPDLDNDGDGVADAVDTCPLRPEDRDGHLDEDGCPDFDNDLDQLADVVDACPDLAEDRDGFQDSDGCPDVDDDGDGIPDEKDFCPRVAEDPDGFDDGDGCPEVDNDGDGVLDLADLCPLQPEALDGTRDADGCPDDIPAVLVSDGVELLHPIRFDRRDRVSEESVVVVQALADLLSRVPGRPVRVGVHTDGSFGAAGLERSSRRAEAIRAVLVAEGIAESDVDAVGFGALQPLTPGGTPETRALNERVEVRFQ